MNKKLVTTCLFLSFLQGSLSYAYDLEVLAFGDSGSCNNPDDISTCKQNKVARSMKEVCDDSGCDMGITLGDNIYEDGVKNANDELFKHKFKDHYDRLNILIYAALGNHDVQDNTLSNQEQIEAQIGHSAYSDTWRMNGEYYDYKVKGVHFMVINSNDFDREQRHWLHSTLKGSTAKWKVVYGHHPIRSNGMHGDTKDLVVELLPLICSYADVYVSGHDHDQQLLESECGVPLIVSGAAGKTESRNTNKSLSLRDWSAKGLGFSRLLFSDDYFIVKYYDEDGYSIYRKKYTKLEERKAPSLYSGSQRIIHKQSETCIHASGSLKVGSGYDVYQKSCSEATRKGSDSDRYKLKPASSEDSDVYSIENIKYDTCLHTSRYQTVLDNYDLYNSGCKSSSAGDYFDVQYNGNGFWTLKNKAYGTCIESSDFVKNSNGSPTFYDKACDGSDKQQFFFEY